MHGDLIGVIHSNDNGLSATKTFTEYGLARNPAAAGYARYGWLGAEQRAADSHVGIILMGVRLYNPTTGRFLSVDPVHGGNANSYDYCYGDPINCFDVSGLVAPLALVAAAGLGVSVGTVIVVIGAAALAGLLAYAIWHGTRAAARKLRTMYSKARKSGKEKANDVPSWAKCAKRRPGETPDQATVRTYKERGKAVPVPKGRGPGSEYNKIKKYLSRN